VLYLPAQELGGDFYDFLPYGDGRIAIAVGDVAGKGSAAALLASLGVGILREHAVHKPSSPAEMLADLNGHLQIPGGNGRFVAMAFGVYDAARQELSLANAGFPQALHVRGNRVLPIDLRGVPLGLLPESQYDSACLHLQPGDVVIFCSDGIYEQTNSCEEEYGVERLVSRLAAMCGNASAQHIAEDIMQAINEHAGENASGRYCNDDRTIVVLRIGSNTAGVMAPDL
jgi:sigma-B regulation protein RsbU (phosphoserine phosphatase)